MLWLVACTVDAQTIWDRAHLAEVKSNLQQPAYQQDKHYVEPGKIEFHRLPGIFSHLSASFLI